MTAHRDIDILLKLYADLRSGRARDLREAGELTHALIGKNVGVGASAISHYECGRRLPRGDVALKYGRLLERIAKRLESAEAPVVDELQPPGSRNSTRRKATAIGLARTSDSP